MSGARVERKLAAILAVDVAGYSRLMGKDEEGTLAALRAIRHELGDPKIKEHRGRIVKTTGDGLLVEFASVVDAVRCAVETQRDMATRNAGIPPEWRIEFRMGINLGDVIVEDGDIFGDGVNIAARLEALAEPGGICVSRVVRDQVRDKLDFSFADMGERQVKNIARPVHVFRVLAAGAAARDEPAPGPWWRAGRALGLSASTITIFLVIFATVMFLSVRPGILVWDHAFSASPPGGGQPDPGAGDPRLIGDPLAFERDKVSLSAAATGTIDRQAAYLREHPDVAVIVEGYLSDDEDAREGRGVLARLRADKVRKALTERGIAAARVQTTAHAGAGEAPGRRVLVVRRD